ncbi:MAG: hypothetical protein ACRDT6_13705 [Micromonosporaceae bacterium]
MDHTTLAPVYPLQRPRTGDDQRFTIGLVLDISTILARHGYPPLAAGADLLRFQQALHTAIYQPGGTQ